MKTSNPCPWLPALLLDSCLLTTLWRLYHAAWLLQGRLLVSSAYMYGNVTALINDARADPFGQPLQPLPLTAFNCMLKVIAIGDWPMFFVVATKDIKSGKHPARTLGAWQTLAYTVLQSLPPS